MPKDDAIVVVGEVKENLGPGGYRVRLEDYAMDVTATLSGKMKNLHRISVLPGDFVDVELNPYDIKKGRIIYRHNQKKQAPGSGADATGPSNQPPAGIHQPGAVHSQNRGQNRGRKSHHQGFKK